MVDEIQSIRQEEQIGQLKTKGMRQKGTILLGSVNLVQAQNYHMDLTLAF